MYQDHSYDRILAAASRAAWQIEDVLPAGSALDFECNFMPENLARTADIECLDADERRTLNQIRGHEYLTIFGLVTLAYVFCREAAVAEGQSGKFYRTKMKTARYYFSHVLPEMDSLIRIMEAGKDNMMAFEADEF